jgi:hypothetical protein
MSGDIHRVDPGDYDVQIFVGTEWNNSGRFTISGEPPLPSEDGHQNQHKYSHDDTDTNATRGPSPT